MRVPFCTHESYHALNEGVNKRSIRNIYALAMQILVRCKGLQTKQMNYEKLPPQREFLDFVRAKVAKPDQSLYPDRV
jgi:hypothetical protein